MNISVNKDKCRQCYTCVRHCPVNAVRVKNGLAEVIASRCIECGSCVKVCALNARTVVDNGEDVKKLLAGPEPVSMLLAPSFAASFNLDNPLRMVSAVKALGFHDVWPVSLGAQLLIPAYQELLSKDDLLISTPCPALVNMVEKYFSSLIPHLAPLVSPMIATAGYVRKILSGRKIVFAGPCIAKKGEVNLYNNLIEYALTFNELKALLDEKAIDIDNCKPDNFEGPLPYYARIIPISGGLSKMLRVGQDLLETESLVVDGPNECFEMLQAISEGKLNSKFMDMLICRGCIDGPARISNEHFYNRKKEIVKYIADSNIIDRYQGRSTISHITGVKLKRRFVNRQIKHPQPDEGEIKKVLASTGKTAEADMTNCGACGYSTCRDKAIAVLDGIAEPEMCLPYLVDKKQKYFAQINEEIEKIKDLNQELDGIINSSYDGICVTDANGVILKTNKAFEYLYDLEDLVGVSVAQLEEKRAMYPSGSMLVIREKRPVTFIQQIHNGRKLYVTGTPIFANDGSLAKILINARDFEELEQLKKKITSNTLESQPNPVNYGHIVAKSQAMSDLLEICRKIAKVDSTVLLTGESGVGKDVLASFIHNESDRKHGPLIKVNCGAIPETLIESELFGYEAGAFTGANKEGKQGLFELAHQGTLFLDEIGELPYLLQVKLLQILQEKRLTRIGGSKHISVDIRIISATNRILEDLVAKEKFRQDLFYRLNVVPLVVPPLRHRKDDIIPLANFYLEKFNNRYNMKKSFSRELPKILLSYSWPGNIRELMNLIERLVVTCEDNVIYREYLPEYLFDKNESYHIAIDEQLPNLVEAVESLEREIIERAYHMYKNSYKIADVLGINQSTVIRKLKKYNIS